MENLINKIDRYLSKTLPDWFNIIKYPDELTGRWSVLMEDGFHMVMGEAIEFKKDGSGVLYSWSASFEPDSTEQPFLWRRTGRNTIKIRAVEDAAWDVANYEIRPFTSKLHINYLRLSDTVNNAGLWLATQPLYKVYK